jgi:hypothetical protein
MPFKRGPNTPATHYRYEPMFTVPCKRTDRGAWNNIGGHWVRERDVDHDTLEPFVDVVFRVFTGKDGGDVIALFPGLPGTNDPATCNSYQTIGQHGSADPAGVVRGSRPATPTERHRLERELTAIGYRLHEVKNCTRAHYEQRRAEIDRMGKAHEAAAKA